MDFSMINKDGKAAVIIIVLLLVIMIAAVPWYFIVSRNVFDPDSLGRTALPQEPIDREIEDELDAQLEDDEELEEELIEEPEPEPEPPMEDKITEIRTVDPELHRKLNAIASEYDAAAVSLAIFNSETGEYFTYENGHADIAARRSVDVNTKFRVASLAKLTTVICAMVLVDEGLLNLDSDISIYLGYEVVNTNYPGTEITTRMLMQHTSSIFDSGAFNTSRDNNTSDSVRFLLERGGSFRHNQPGTTFEYTNFGYSVLGAICENVSGKSLDTLAREVLFEPLGIDAAYVPENMQSTDNIAVLYNDRHEITQSVETQLEVTASETLGHDLHLAQGNLTITAIDYARILAMLGNGGMLRDVRILSQNAVRAIHETDVEGAGYRQGLATRYSFGDVFPGVGFYWHSGSGYGLLSQYMYSPPMSATRGVVVMTTGARNERNQSGMVGICTEMSAAVWDIWETLERQESEPDEDEPMDDD